MTRHVATTLGILALVVAASVVGIVGGLGLQTDSTVDPDAVLIHVTLTPDGDARWRVEYRTRLDDDNVTEAFESLRRDVETNTSTYRERFARRMEATVADAENATGRDMAVQNVTVSAERRQLPQEYGVVTYRFTWVGFATVTDGRVRAGDALSGLFLDGETTLVVAWPDGYRSADVVPRPDDRLDRAVVWRGPTDFGDGEPRIVVAQNTTGPGGADGRGGGSRWWSDSLLLPGVAALFVGGAAVAFAAYRRRRDHAAGGAGDETVEASAAGRSSELLSNEEQVLQLVETHGGRLKQRTVAEELGWSAARTSQVVGDLQDAGELDSFRKGRENVLTLPNEDGI